MIGAVGSQRHRRSSRRLGIGHPRHQRPAIRHVHRQHLVERRPGQTLLFERSAAEHQQPAAALGDEGRGALELSAAEERRFDVAEDHRVVGEQLGALLGESGRQCRRPRRRGLHEEGRPAVVGHALAHHRIDVEAGVARQRPLQEGVLVAGGALHQQQPAPPARRLDQHAAGVVLAGNLARRHRHRHLVDGRRGRIAATP